MGKRVADGISKSGLTQPYFIVGFFYVYPKFLAVMKSNRDQVLQSSNDGKGGIGTLANYLNNFGASMKIHRYGGRFA
jgi:hypothetical protein